MLEYFGMLPVVFVQDVEEYVVVAVKVSLIFENYPQKW
jgi:hypothetical protein